MALRDIFSKSKDAGAEPVTPAAPPDKLEPPAFPSIGDVEEPSAEAFDPKALTDTVGALIEKVEALTTGVKASDVALVQANRLAEQTVANRPSVADPLVVDVRGEDLPDRDEVGNEAYNVAVAGLVNKRVEQGRVADTAASKRTAQYDTLWNNFEARHPDLAQFRDIAQVIAAERLSAGARRGLSPEAVAFTNEDGFLDDVAGGVVSRVAAIRKAVADAEGGNEGDPKPDPNPTVRSAGIFGGSPPAPVEVKKDLKESNMTDEMKEVQRAGGFI